MAYKLFLSYGSSEEVLAKEVKRIISDAFKGEIEFFFSSADIMAGDDWKQIILKSLKECDGILLILTPNYVKRTWSYIEWSAFWLNDKKRYVLITDGVDVQELVAPMRDNQITSLFLEADSKKLFATIARDANYDDAVPYDQGKILAFRSKVIFDNLKKNEERLKFSPYKSNIELLPNDDIRKKEIFWHFYDHEADSTTASRIFEQINDNSMKGDILQKMVEKGDYEFIEKSYEFVESKNNLLPLLKALVLAGQENSSLLEKLLDYVKVSQTAIRGFGEFLISNMGDQSKTLPVLLELFTNMAELRKLGQYLIDNGYSRSPFVNKVLNNLTGSNSAEAQKLLVYIIKNDPLYNPTEIKNEIGKLALFNQREAAKVIIELSEKDMEAVKELIYEKKIITNSEILKNIESIIDKKQGVTSNQ